MQQAVSYKEENVPWFATTQTGNLDLYASLGGEVDNNQDENKKFKTSAGSSSSRRVEAWTPPSGPNPRDVSYLTPKKSAPVPEDQGTTTKMSLNQIDGEPVIVYMNQSYVRNSGS